MPRGQNTDVLRTWHVFSGLLLPLYWFSLGIVCTITLQWFPVAASLCIGALALGALVLARNVNPGQGYKEVLQHWLKRYLVTYKVAKSMYFLTYEDISQLEEFSERRLADLLSFANEIASEADIPAQVNVVERHPNKPQNIVAVDIGATRTKFLVAQKWVQIADKNMDDIKSDGEMSLLPALSSRDLWREDRVSSETDLKGDNEAGADHKNETSPRQSSPPTSPPGSPSSYNTTAVSTRMRAHLEDNDIDCTAVHRVVFSVPGTVELAGVYRDRLTVVKNMPSFSRKFRGLDFQKAFGPIFPGSKISALSDNMGAALGAACLSPNVKSGLVLVLGTAPAVATFFRDPSGKDKYIETGIWQSWVWFSKIPLSDPYGYCGGIKMDKETGRITIKPPNAYKIPHRQARIRFALDNNTWLRFMGRNPHLDKSVQKPLDIKEATDIWANRLQSSLNKLAEKFHDIYGPPEVVYVLGGNAVRCHGLISSARYETSDHSMAVQVPVLIPKEDAKQQMMHMAGLVYSTQFKVKQVFAPGQDPLARGWTRGGEICMWVKRREFQNKKKDKSTGYVHKKHL